MKILFKNLKFLAFLSFSVFFIFADSTSVSKKQTEKIDCINENSIDDNFGIFELICDPDNTSICFFCDKRKKKERKEILIISIWLKEKINLLSSLFLIVIFYVFMTCQRNRNQNLNALNIRNIKLTNRVQSKVEKTKKSTFDDDDDENIETSFELNDTDNEHYNPIH